MVWRVTKATRIGHALHVRIRNGLNWCTWTYDDYIPHQTEREFLDYVRGDVNYRLKAKNSRAHKKTEKDVTKYFI